MDEELLDSRHAIMKHEFSSKELQKLFQYCCALTLQDSDAYDLLQTAMEKYLRSQSADLDYPLSYMRRIIRNAHIDQLRHNRIIQWDDFDESNIDSTDIGWQSLEQMIIDENEIENLFSMLSGIEREILFLWAVEGYSVQEVAGHVGMPKGTILSRIYRMRQRIKKSHQKIYGNGAV